MAKDKICKGCNKRILNYEYIYIDGIYICKNCAFKDFSCIEALENIKSNIKDWHIFKT